MAREKVKQKCFIIMPITTPPSLVREYNGDAHHFTHVLEHLFIPALEGAGFDPVSPQATGSNIIQADIIKQLSDCDLVLCDMSILNANVFFEFGIRTALNKPVALVVDDKTVGRVPFDTGIINHYRYDSSLVAWTIKKDLDGLTTHLKKTSKGENALWKYFGVAQTGAFKPGESTLGEKIDLVWKEVRSLKNQMESGGQVTGLDGLTKSMTSIDRDMVYASLLLSKQDYVGALNHYSSAFSVAFDLFGPKDLVTIKAAQGVERCRKKLNMDHPSPDLLDPPVTLS